MRHVRFASKKRRGATASAIVAAAVLFTTFAATPAPASTSCISPPAVYPEDQLTAGMTVTGMTTIQGTTPTSFTAEILGTIPNGIMLGIDLIVAKITGPQSFLDSAGGAFYGISGSPLSISGRFVGTSSYAFNTDPTVIGITPGQAVIDVLSYDGSAPQPAERVGMTGTIARAIARATGKPASDVTASFEQIPTPLGVSGLSGRQLTDFQAMLDEQNANVKVFASGSTPAPTATSATRFVPGAPIGSVLSYGDATIWALGTTSVVCDDEVVAYGHSLFYDPLGPLTIGMSGGNVLAVLHTPGKIGEMLGNVTDARGTITQDRFAGVAGVFGTLPPTVPITTTFSSPDTGLTRTGSTYSVFQADYWFIDTVYSHLFMNLAAVFQRVGSGTTSIDYVIDGTTAAGVPFQVSNRNMDYSSYDATEASYKLLNALSAIKFNRFEDVTFTGVSATGSITQQQLEGAIVGVRTSSSLQPTLRSRGVVKARAGSTVTIEVTLQPAEGPNQTATLKVHVPKGSRGSEVVTLRGGSHRTYFSTRGLKSFDQLLALLNGGEHPNDLIAQAFGNTTIMKQSIIVSGKDSFTIQVVR